MVVPAWWAEVALVGVAGRPRRGVVDVAVRGRRAAAGRGAGRVPGADQVLQPATGPVAVLAIRVIARTRGDRPNVGLQPAQQPRELCLLRRGGNARACTVPRQ